MLQEQCSVPGTVTAKSQMMLDKTNDQHAALFHDEIFIPSQAWGHASSCQVTGKKYRYNKTAFQPCLSEG